MYRFQLESEHVLTRGFIYEIVPYFSSLIPDQSVKMAASEKEMGN